MRIKLRDSTKALPLRDAVDQPGPRRLGRHAPGARARERQRSRTVPRQVAGGASPDPPAPPCADARVLSRRRPSDAAPRPAWRGALGRRLEACRRSGPDLVQEGGDLAGEALGVQAQLDAASWLRAGGALGSSSASMPASENGCTGSRRWPSTSVGAWKVRRSLRWRRDAAEEQPLQQRAARTRVPGGRRRA